MPTRIAFWTHSFEFGMEAIASEVATLRRHFPWSVVWGINHRRWAIVAPRRGHYSVHPKLHLLFRGATRLLEPIFHLNHIFGSMSDWFHLQGVRRPTILTVALDSDSVSPHLLERVDQFVVEFEAGREQLLAQGISPKRIRTVFPPVDLTKFVPTDPPDGSFTVLFASSPELPGWLEARGLPQLLDAADLRPEMRFRLLWRPWGRSREAIVDLVRERGLRNVEIVDGRFDDMPSRYQAAHVTVAPFTERHRCKPMPNSLIESLACGRPILCTPVAGLAGMVQEARASVIVSASGVEIVEGLDRLRAGWTSYSLSARKLAERCFSEERFLKGYQRTYYEVLRSHLKRSLHFSGIFPKLMFSSSSLRSEDRAA
jgi:glycosyltransferase involved in cell wall biosynthesis